MKIHTSRLILAGALIMASLAGCGGGGGSSAVKPSPGTTEISGTASVGIIYPGTVKVYALDANGVKGTLLSGSVPTTIDGIYNAPLGGYSGAIQVEVSGTYTDEATGQKVTIPHAKPLHALVDKVNETTDNNRIVAVTPLTELAWRKATATGTKPATTAAIVGANKLVKDLFKISDIIGIEPVRPDSATMANASQESQAYTLLLGAISTMTSTASGSNGVAKLDSLLATLAAEIDIAETSGSMSAATITALTSALASSPLGGDFPSAVNQLARIGNKSQTIILSTSGTLPSETTIYVIQGTIILPADPLTSALKVSLRSDENGQTLEDVFLLSGIAEGMDSSFTLANYLPEQQQLEFSVVLDTSTTGIGTGEFATLIYDVAKGATISAADFSLESDSISITDSNGVEISGVTVTIK